MPDPVSRETAGSPAPPAGRRFFAPERLPLARRYAGWLASDGVTRGLIGPREGDRLWERHLLNCAVLEELVAPGASLADVGSGAGLPGLVLAIARPDLRVTLVEPLLRRTRFLEEVVADLGLDNCAVQRARAEELHGVVDFDVVTARAVAPLGRLLRWSVPLLAPGGAVLAMKGSSAAAEIEDAAAELRALRCAAPTIETVGAGIVDPPTNVVRVARGADARVG